MKATEGRNEVRSASRQKPPKRLPKPATPPAGASLLTRKQAATFLQIGESTLCRWAEERIGPPFMKLNPAVSNSQVRYRISDLTAWLEARMTVPKDSGPIEWAKRSTQSRTRASVQ
jgi:hypothetical protein